MKKNKIPAPVADNPIEALGNRLAFAQNLAFEATHWIDTSIDKLERSTTEAEAAVAEANAMIEALTMNVKTLNDTIESNRKLIKSLEALLNGE